MKLQSCDRPHRLYSMVAFAWLPKAMAVCHGVCSAMTPVACLANRRVLADDPPLDDVAAASAPTGTKLADADRRGRDGSRS
jgi:hypothetical protein